MVTKRQKELERGESPCEGSDLSDRGQALDAVDLKVGLSVTEHGHNFKQA